MNHYRSSSPLHYHHTHTPPSKDMAFGSKPAAAAPLTSNFSDDVVFYVGKHRQTYHVNFETLIRSSSYFRNLLHSAPPPHLASQPSRPPIVIDCEEPIFESLLLLMRYGTLQALPPLSAAEIFRLKQEAQFYGIHYTEPRPSKSEISYSDDGISDLSCSSTSCSSPSSSPKSMMHMSPPPSRGAGKRASQGRYYEGVRVACTVPRQLSELPEFPLDLADPSRLVLVSCLDQEKASIYRCDCVANSSRNSATQWAINFHHRHAFCTACGRTPNVSPKHFAEMFMAAAAHYYAQPSPGQAAPNGGWRASSDSTCMLRFISSAGDGPDGCGCSAGGGRAAKEAQPSIWATSCFYSHAFCTCCGEVAKGPVLLSLILAVRYGGSHLNKMSTSVRSSFSQTSGPHGRSSDSLFEKLGANVVT